MTPLSRKTIFALFSLLLIFVPLADVYARSVPLRDVYLKITSEDDANNINQNCTAETPHPDKTVDVPDGGFIWIVGKADFIMIRNLMANVGVDQAIIIDNRNAFIICSDQALNDDGGSTILGIIYTLLIAVITLFAGTLMAIIWFCSYIVLYLLTYSHFATSLFVQAAWAGVLAVVNLFFILGLLAIAFIITIRREGIAGFQRLLPPLLLGAILINFSLLIGGVVIDASRIASAVLVRSIIGNEELTASGFGGGLLMQSSVFSGAFRIVSIDPQCRGDCVQMVLSNVVSPPPGVSLKYKEVRIWHVVQAALAAALMAVLIVGLIVITVGLLNRLIWLFILLAISPAAYVAMAFPGGMKYALQWWRSFIGKVIYAPAAVFFLILVMLMTKYHIDQQNFITSLIEICAISGVLVFGAQQAKKFSGVGAETAYNFGKKVAMKASGASRAVAVGTLLKNQANDFSKKASTNLGKGRGAVLKSNRFTSWMVGAKRDDKGNLKPGQTSVMDRFASRSTNWMNAEEERKARRGREAAHEFTMMGPPNVNADNLSAARLKQGSVAIAISNTGRSKHENIHEILRRGSIDQVRALVSNKDYQRTLSPDDRERFIRAMMDNGDVAGNAQERSRLMDSLYRIEDELAKE